MTKSEYHKSVGALRTKYQQSINDVFIWSSLAIEALEGALGDEALLTAKKFPVPSKKPEKKVNRTKEQVAKIVQNAKEHELHKSIFSYLVAQVEAFLNEVLSLALRFDEKKLKTRIQGVDHIKKIDVNEVIDRPSRSELIESLIEKELISLFYAAPTLQFQYMEIVLDIELEEDLKSSWIEIKASRDLLVHNSSLINRIYIKKAVDFARGSEGQKLIMDRNYMNESLANMKSLIGRISSRVQKNAKSA
ncbi:hypothetical protein CWE13_09540 [Aliidiomarina shirensis]|uniref:Uncharacterized protein n=1 Tax=Aliidiomarina shirensis TaxID=1048642 RepID=A0A432WQQ6_9GAMM|nr:hypothetical protein [Aliidiomarina shirensis]RUO36105.1 hypothetical protein CWE13_09540 [Aliidiomarina shirensis]